MLRQLVREAVELDRRVDDVFRRLLRLQPGTGLGPVGGRHWHPFVPAADVLRSNGDLVIRIELAGVDPAKDVSVTIDDDALVVRGERKRPGEAGAPGEWGFDTLEASYGPFERRVRLPHGAEPAEVRAEYHQGILQITVPVSKGASAEAGIRIPIASN
jgi:HSP20 family protein